MDYESDNDEIYTPPEILEDSKLVSIKLLPEKSRKKYETVYKAFMDWRLLKDVDSLTENVLLNYFEELSEYYKSTSLWTHYSMLRSTLNINENINIEHYPKLRAFLKFKAAGYHAKKTRTFTPQQITEFINKAPDHKYLATKVCLLLGIKGACRTNELHSMNIQDVQDLGTSLLVAIPESTTKVRKFKITDQHYRICKKYMNLRPPDKECNSFFLNYQNGKCTAQKIGINKIGAMGKQTAKFLMLPNPEEYTGHSFRKSYSTLLADKDKHTIDSYMMEMVMASNILESVDKHTHHFTSQTSITNENINLNSEPFSQNYQDDKDANIKKEMETTDNISQSTDENTNFSTQTFTNENITFNLDSKPVLLCQDCNDSGINIKKEVDLANILQSLNQNENFFIPQASSTNENINLNLNSKPVLLFQNCNITINVISEK